MNPQGKPFLVISIILILFGIVALATSSVGVGIACILVGALGTFLHFKGKPKQ